MATEKQLIDATDFVKTFWKRVHDGEIVTLMDVEHAIINAPAVNAAPVVHGRWMWEGRFKACSVCGSYIDWDDTLGANHWKFCPYCGAKMDGERGDAFNADP